MPEDQSLQTKGRGSKGQVATKCQGDGAETPLAQGGGTESRALQEGKSLKESNVRVFG